MLRGERGGAVLKTMPTTEQLLVPCGERVLDVLTIRPDAPGRHPFAVLVAGSRAGAEAWQSWGQRLAAQGVAVVGVAQPGFGRSAGPWDFAGPATLTALDALLVWARRLAWVKPLAVGFGGYSSGATCAALLASRHHARVLVGAAGVYDLPDWWAHRAARSPWSLGDLAAHVSPDELAGRSPLALAAEIRCPVRLVHGAADEVVPAAHAERLAAALAAAGRPAELIIEPGRGHSSLGAGPFVDGLVEKLVER